MLAAVAVALALHWKQAPAVPRRLNGSVAAGAGDALVVFGGARSRFSCSRGGWVFRLGGRRWRPLPAAPLSGRFDVSAVWTGHQLLVVGGTDCHGRDLASGAAYTPATGRWQRLPPAPRTEPPSVALWTGRELVLWGSLRCGAAGRRGAAYDPRRRRWRLLPRSPVSFRTASAVVSGGELLIAGGNVDCDGYPPARRAGALAYDLRRNRWRRLPSPPLVPEALALTRAGGRVVGFDYTLRSAVFDPRSQSWRPLRPLPLRGGECSPTSAALGPLVVGWYCGTGAVLQPGAARWQRLAPPARPLDGPIALDGALAFPGTTSVWLLMKP